MQLRRTPATVVIVLIGMGLLGLFMIVAVSLVVLQLFTENDDPITITNNTITATPSQTTNTAPAQPPLEPVQGLGTLRFDATGQYAFPIAANPDLFTWTHYHWDNTNAVDIEIGPEHSQSAFDQIAQVKLVAITSGTLRHYSGSIGGLGYMLQADDGRDYYYAHLSELSLPDGIQVAPGQPIGTMGNTGEYARYIEPHLHLSIGTRDTLWENQPDINAAEWLRDTFDLPWRDWPPNSAPFSQPGLRPVNHERAVIVTYFDQWQSRGLPQPGIEIGFTGLAPDEPQIVYAPMGGQVNVIRWTDSYGTRIQITNDVSQYTVVVSGVTQWAVGDGQIINRGDIIGSWNVQESPRLNVMIFQGDTPIDPLLLLQQ